MAYRYSNPELLAPAFLSRSLSQPSQSSDLASVAALKSLHGLENLGTSLEIWYPIPTYTYSNKKNWARRPSHYTNNLLRNTISVTGSSEHQKYQVRWQQKKLIRTVTTFTTASLTYTITIWKGASTLCAQWPFAFVVNGTFSSASKTEDLHRMSEKRSFSFNIFFGGKHEALHPSLFHSLRGIINREKSGTWKEWYH